MALIQSTAIPSGATDYELEQSLKFDGSSQPYLSFTPATNGTSTDVFTVSFWFKRGGAGYGGTGVYQPLFDVAETTIILSDDKLHGNLRGTESGNCFWYSNGVFRDPSAWYHIVGAWDSTQATDTNRFHLYVNGVEQTFSSITYMPQHREMKNTSTHYIGTNGAGLNYHPQGYFADYYMIDGQQLTPADFGETGDYGEWKPIEYEGTYGTNGFYLPFKQDYTVEGFSTITWKGNSVNNTYFGGVGFNPDLIWTKARSIGYSGSIYDSVRGYGSIHNLVPSTTEAENGGNHVYGGIASSSADGFTTFVGTDGGNPYANHNEDGKTYVAWNWDMGGSNATNTDGSITSTVRANTTYGQSIVSFNGSGGTSATIGHGLSSAPEVVIYKSRSQTGNWSFMTTAIDGSYDRLVLNDTSAKTDDSRTAPTTSVITDLGFDSGTATIAYCFHSVTGYSKFGSYTGNGSSTGPSVTTGFKPSFVMVKISSDTGGWEIWDNTRNPNNPLTNTLQANLSNAELTSGRDIDFTNTGFQIKNTTSNSNASGQTYIYMAFADTREYAYWLDQSGNNNDWTSNNLTESDISVDSPTNNFATLNPLTKSASSLKEGNLAVVSGSAAWQNRISTISMKSGKWYAEVYLKTISGAIMVGVTDTDNSLSTIDDATVGSTLYRNNGNKRLNGAYTSYGATYAQDDIIGVAVDMDSNTVTFYKNNASQGAISAVFDTTSFDVMGSDSSICIANFGQDSSFAGNKTAQGNQDGNNIGDFYYTPPTGFLALCTKNLPDVDVVPSEHFNTVLYTGANPNASQSITGVGFQPDFLWIKSRVTGYGHALQDAVRGSTKRLQSDTTGAESTSTTYVSSFDSDGFSLGIDYGQNAPNEPYVAWNWKANGSGSSNTDGSITSTVSANVDAGFSILTYTGNVTSGATVGHGLSKAPEFIIIKKRSASALWAVYNKSDGNTKVSHLDLTAASYTSAGIWNNTTPDASVFTLGNNALINGTSTTYVAYCFHSVDGYSKVGSYTGNGNADGTFVYTGFRPAFVMVKRTDAAESWSVSDSKRSSSGKNVIDKFLEPNTSGAEATNTFQDFTSNGFKFRHENFNASGASYIFLAFAETPFKNSNAR